MDKLKTLFKEYKDEVLLKVQWPKFEELQDSTVIVLVASFIIAILIALMDLMFKNSLSFLYDIIR